MKATKAEQAEALETLRRELPPGSTVWCVLRHVARSGMTRWIDLYKIEDSDRRWFSRTVSKATGHTFDERRESIKIGGCGMDMGFALVYDLSRTLYPEGYGCIGEGCPSNDHNNGDRDYTSHLEDSAPDSTFRHWHRDGGYALRHRWL